MPTIGITQEMLNEYFWPTLLHMLVPFIVLIVIFGIIRILVARMLRHNRTIRIVVDGLIVMVFLLVAGLISPLVLSTVKIPDPPDLAKVNTDVFNSVEAAVRSVMENASSSESESEDSENE